MSKPEKDLFGPYPFQNNWFSIIDSFGGDEKKAREHVVKWLRKAADLVENNQDNPSIFGCDNFPGKNRKEFCEFSLMETISITFSKLCGG